MDFILWRFGSKARVGSNSKVSNLAFLHCLFAELKSFLKAIEENVVSVVWALSFIRILQIENIEALEVQAFKRLIKLVLEEFGVERVAALILNFFFRDASLFNEHLSHFFPGCHWLSVFRDVAGFAAHDQTLSRDIVLVLQHVENLAHCSLWAHVAVIRGCIDQVDSSTHHARLYGCVHQEVVLVSGRAHISSNPKGCHFKAVVVRGTLKVLMMDFQTLAKFSFTVLGHSVVAISAFGSGVALEGFSFSQVVHCLQSVFVLFFEDCHILKEIVVLASIRVNHVLHSTWIVFVFWRREVTQVAGTKLPDGGH
jgi:hypothetical protein